MPKKTLSDDDQEEITIALKDTLKPGESDGKILLKYNDIFRFEEI